MDPAPGEAERSSLALVNTRFQQSGTSVDLLANTPMTAGPWLELHAASTVDATGTASRIGPGVALDSAELAQLIRLRESIRALFAAHAAGTIPHYPHLAAVNAAAAGAPLVPVLSWDATGPLMAERRRSRTEAATAMARLAADAMTLLTSPEAAELTACGAHNCTRWFLRTHAARQWCSTRCGDRVRAARHYARHHRGDNV
jgi:predicted RNA-binding Zn ribbon-like protein